MSATKRELQHALPFAMEPVVYDFAINEHGTFADLLAGADALLPAGYYALTVPALLRRIAARSRRCAARSWTASAPPAARSPELRGMVQTLFDALLAARQKRTAMATETLAELLEANGFDREQHEQIRTRPARGPHRPRAEPPAANAVIEDVRPEDVVDIRRADARTRRSTKLGLAAPARRRGRRRHARRRRRQSRGRRAPAWSKRCIRSASSAAAPHVSRSAPRQEPPRRASVRARRCRTSFTTSYLTHEPIEQFLATRRQLRLRRPAAALARPQRRAAAGADGARPAVRVGGDAAADARRAAAEGPREPARRADRLGAQARARRATTPTTSRSSACTRSATGSRCRTCSATACSRDCSRERPQLKYLLLHNIDTLGADLDPGAARPAHRERRVPHVRGDHAGASTTAAAGWPA